MDGGGADAGAKAAQGAGLQRVVDVYGEGEDAGLTHTSTVAGRAF
jgi:hypothetical protein